MKLEASGTDVSGAKLTPSWEICIGYCDEIRKKSYELGREENYALLESLEKAVAHSETRELHFSAPFGRYIIQAASSVHQTDCTAR